MLSELSEREDMKNRGVNSKQCGAYTDKKSKKKLYNFARKIGEKTNFVIFSTIVQHIRTEGLISGEKGAASNQMFESVKF